MLVLLLLPPLLTDLLSPLSLLLTLRRPLGPDPPSLILPLLLPSHIVTACGPVALAAGPPHTLQMGQGLSHAILVSVQSFLEHAPLLARLLQLHAGLDETSCILQPRHYCQ
eukprot:15436564-Alexandrium_andersonii.AAC.1